MCNRKMINVINPEIREEFLDLARAEDDGFPIGRIWGKDIVAMFENSSVKEMIPYSRQFKDKMVYFRPLCPIDEKAIQEFFYSHKPETIYQRYLMIVKDMPPEVAQARVNVDYTKDMAIAGFDSPRSDGRMVCIGRYIRGKNESAEAAVVVKEDYQGRGIGTFLNEILIEAAKRHGLKKLVSYAGHSNLIMIHILKKLGFQLQESREIDGFLAVMDLRSKYGT